MNLDESKIEIPKVHQKSKMLDLSDRKVGSLERLLAMRTNLTPVGDTAVADIGKFADGQQISTRSADKLISTILIVASRGLGASAPVLQIVESLIWPFVARRSKRSVWFTDFELRRLIASFRETLKILIRYESEDNKEQTFCKFWLDTFLCQVFQDSQRPPKDDWIKDPLFKGWLKRFVARSIARRDVSFIYSLQKGSKRGWPALGSIKEKQALDKHKARLSREPEFFSEELYSEISYIASKVFARTGTRKMTKFLPTGSACLQASRREGGALSLVDRYHLPFNGSLNVDTLILGRLPSLVHSLDRWRQEQYNKVLDRAANDLKVKFGASDFMRKPSLRVKVIALPEPGKFRIITEGDGYLYSALQPLQGVMLTAWKAAPESTMSDNDLTSAIQDIDDDMEECTHWCSVDYEAATDLIKKLGSLAVLNQLPANDLFKLAYDAIMLPNCAVYPDGSEVVANEGQLMGHPLSFPMLCIINLAVYRVAINRWLSDDSVEEAFDTRLRIARKMRHNVKVNGDDMAFKCMESFYPIFVATASEAGFKMSQGKQYLSKDTCIINSQLFKRVNRKMKRFGYLNLKLVKGTSLKSGDSSAVPTQISRDLNEMVRLCPWTQVAIPSALNRWRKDWFGKIYQPNWYLPVHLGGFGINPSFAPSGTRITRSQREMAARFINDPRMAIYRREGMSIPTAELSGALANWKMIPTGDDVPEGLVDDIDDAWLARLAYASRASKKSANVSDKVFISRFRPQYRLSPMSIEGLARYWDAKVYASKLPPCPPVGYLKIKYSL